MIILHMWLQGETGEKVSEIIKSHIYIIMNKQYHQIWEKKGKGEEVGGGVRLHWPGQFKA